jgi:hypothetical protein
LKAIFNEWFLITPIAPVDIALAGLGLKSVLVGHHKSA